LVKKNREKEGVSVKKTEKFGRENIEIKENCG